MYVSNPDYCYFFRFILKICPLSFFDWDINRRKRNNCPQGLEFLILDANYRLSLVSQIKALWGRETQGEIIREESQAYGWLLSAPLPLPSLLPSAPQQQQDRGSSVFEAVAWMISSEPDLRFPCRRSYDRDGNKITQTRGEYGYPNTLL